MQSHWILLSDPPQHTRLRGLVEPVFSRGRVESLRARVQWLVDELLDGVDPSAGMDVVNDLAFPLPSTIVADLLGIVAATTRCGGGCIIVRASILTVASIERAYASQEALTADLKELVAERRRRSTG